MLAKKYRLNRPEFNEYFKCGQRFHSDIATIIHTPSPTFKASVVVGKKVSKQAVVRNRLRRQVYGVFDELLVEHHELMTGIFILILKPSASKSSRASLRNSIFDTLARIRNTR